MKNFILLTLMVVAISASAQVVSPEKKWTQIINAIALVESEGRPELVSKNGLYVGYLQISKILVRQCNQIAGYQKYTYDDRLSKDKSISMFIDFQEYFNPEGNMEKAIRMWNSGDPKCMSRKRPTEAYYRRVMAKYTAMAKQN